MSDRDRESPFLRKDGRLRWVRIWAFARYDLHLSKQELMEMTWYQFNCLVDRYVNEQEQQDWRAALVAHILANVHRASGTPVYDVEDFMPLRRGKRKKEDKRMSTEQLMAAAQKITAVFGGGSRKKQTKDELRTLVREGGKRG